MKLLFIAAALCSAMATVQALVWCTISAEEQAMCEKMVPLFTRVKANNTYTCLQQADSDACVEAIGTGKADIVSVFLNGIVEAAEKYGTQLLLAEAAGVGPAAKPYVWYALAVVKKDLDMSQGWESLRGKRSCHTGYRKFAGWQMPVGTLIYNGVLTLTDKHPDVPDDLEAVMGFFSGGSCVPSANPTPVDGVDGICDLCKGDCTWTEAEPYQDHAGALLCLDEDAGDIAFNIGGTVPEEKRGDYKLVCADGTTAPMGEFGSCNLAAVPDRHIITGGDKTATELDSIIKDILAAAAAPAFAKMFFTTEAGPVNPDGLLFSGGTGAFAEVSPSTIHTLGATYDAYATIERVDAGTLPVLVMNETKRVHKRFESTTIAFAVLLAAITVLCAVLLFNMRRSNRKLLKELSKTQGADREWGASHAQKA